MVAIVVGNIISVVSVDYVAVVIVDVHVVAINVLLKQSVLFIQTDKIKWEQLDLI